MSAKKLTMWLGYVFLAIGILGFVPGVTNSSGMLLGVFSVDTMHNVVHLVTGLLALFLAGSSAKMFLKVFGIVYLLIAILGFMGSGVVLGMMMNMADNLLHLVVGVLALSYGFKKDGMMM